MFTEEQVKQLSAQLLSRHVNQRQQGGRALSYIEGWHAIAEANRIFGFDKWIRRTLELTKVAEYPREIGASKKPGYGVSYLAKVEIVVTTPGNEIIYRHGTGAGHGIDVDLGLAHESAAKEAETDAMKRALMTFGNPFGLALYDKSQASVSDVDLGRLAEFEDQIEAATDIDTLEKAILEYTPDIVELRKKRQADWRLLNEKVNNKRAQLQEEANG